MQKYFITLSYDGSSYHGWQYQPNGITVQEELERGLSTILRINISIVGAGRTDAGVHARKMVAHFETDIAFDSEQLKYKLNRFLQRDINVHKIEKVDSSMHARFSAQKRTYHYYVHTSKSAFMPQYSFEITYALDFERMNRAAAYLLGNKDFKCFCKSGSDVKTTYCHITEAVWRAYTHELHFEHSGEDTPTYWYFVISADRFLRNMVRAIVGTLIEVGRGKITIEEFKQIVDEGKRSDAGESVPGKALFLWDVVY